MKRSILAAALLIGSAGLANADPLTLTRVQMDGVVAGVDGCGGCGCTPSCFDPNFSFTKRIDINVNERINLEKFVRTRVDLDPAAVTNAEAYATCSGICTAQTLTDTRTVFGGGSSYSGSYSATRY